MFVSWDADSPPPTEAKGHEEIFIRKNARACDAIDQRPANASFAPSARKAATKLAQPLAVKDLAIGVSIACEIGNSVALRPFPGPEVAPGALGGQELARFFRDGLGTFWHQSGTATPCRWSTLKVYGVDGPRIPDASIMARVTTGSTMAPCVVIGEQAAACLQREAR